WEFLGVIAEPGAWGAMLYFMLSMLTGIVYFSWAVIGLSLSLSLMILIIGLPVAVIVLFSFRSLALLEGRIVEALLGERMPRRSLFTDRGAGWLDQVKGLFLEPRTWSSVAYLVLQLPLGIIYFTTFTILLALSLSFIASPILEIVFDQALFHLGSVAWHVQVWQMPFVVAGGFLLLTGTLQIAKLIGRWHARYAKWLLVGPG
ncbi:MAG: sensor domain-containing protein, partial [Anaerolineales bacterium]